MKTRDGTVGYPTDREKPDRLSPKSKPAATNVVDLMEALRRSVGKEAAPAKAGKPAKNGRKASAGQKEMLMPIEGKKAKEAATKKPQQSRSGDRPDGREAPVTTDRCQACAVRDTKVQTIIRASMSIAGLMEPLGHGPSVEELGGTGNHTIGYLTLQIDIPGTV